MGAFFAARRTFIWALLACLGIGLSGCGFEEVVPPIAIAAAVEGASLNQTGKTASDHIVSWVTGEDCSVLRSQTKNTKYCMTKAEIAQQEAELHRPYVGSCYKVRGNVTCYDEPDATHSSETNVYNTP